MRDMVAGCVEAIEVEAHSLKSGTGIAVGLVSGVDAYFHCEVD